MGSLRALVLAAVTTVMTAGLASAADLLPPPPPVDPGLAVPFDTSGWYIRGDVGVGASQVSGVTSILASYPGAFTPPGFQYERSKLGDAGFVDWGVGYQVNSWFRADVIGEYRTRAQWNAVTSYVNGPAPGFCGTGGLTGATPARCYDTYGGSVASGVLLANAYFDLGTWWNITPYVGAGVGFAHHWIGTFTDQSIGNTGGGFGSDTQRTNFAWALMAGLGYTVNPRLKLELGYRYLNMGTIQAAPIICQPSEGCVFEQQRFKLASHDFKLGMRWMLDDPTAVAAPIAYAPPPPPPPPPLVRKY